ncbi:MAG: hypothetical protein ACXWX7_19470 [Candidatus Binatia bacterium]
MEPTLANSGNTESAAAFRGDEKLASLFQPDTLLSAQYFDTLRRKTRLEPEKRLMLALLEDAILNFQDNRFAHNSKHRRLFEEAEQWITTPGGDWMFSFDNVCEALGFNPEYVRRGLLRWKEKNRQKLSPNGARDEKRLAS